MESPLFSYAIALTNALKENQVRFDFQESLPHFTSPGCTIYELPKLNQ